MSHVAHMNESCRTYKWAVSHIWRIMSRAPRTKSFKITRSTWYVWVMSHAHVTDISDGSCHTYTWVTPHSHITRVMSHVHTSHVTRIHESCPTYTWIMPHIRMSHVTHTHESCHTWTYESCHTYTWLMSYLHMSHVTHTHDSIQTYTWVMSQL